MFCAKCGSQIDDQAVICVHCGASVSPLPPAAARAASKEWNTTVMLCVLLGGLGVHRFYTKNTGIAVAQLVLGLLSCFIVSSIWALFDFAYLSSGKYITGDGRVLRPC